MNEQSDPPVPPIRAGLAYERERAWQRLAAPGTWWDSATRIAIAAEVRNAATCSLCHDRKAALSPYSIDGTHRGLGVLPEGVIEITHRALSLVPQEVINFFDLDVELYLKDHEIRDFATEHRALTMHRSSLLRVTCRR